ncbi:MAG: RHS repeat-associated core domain-containing protein [Candidatus Brocadia sp.]|nr:MAG: RHS repeat-associated core domain-containing protein [Candidatus Brocadia sp.]
MSANEVAPRWVGSGWTIFNNKGKPVRQFEPFFNDTHKPDFDTKIGVSPVLFYDPAERVIATLHPNHTYEKVVFDPWQQTTYDVNDTCAPRNQQTGDPHTDPDIQGYVAEYFNALPANPAQPWQTWHAQRIGGVMGADERNAAQRAEAHTDTPTTAYFDALGRPFLTVARNRVVCPGHDLDGTEDSFATRVELDIEGNQREVRDERKLPVNYLPTGAIEQRIVMRYAYDMLGNRIHQLSMEAGARWMLNDVAGKPIRAWDSRGHNLTTTYDALRRPIEQYVRGTFNNPDPLKPNSDPRTLNPPSEAGLLVDKIEYGEGIANAEALNLHTRIYRHFDSAGVATNARLDANGNPTEAYDFKGNLLHSTRRLVSDYKTIPDWLLPAEPQLDAETFQGSTRYDALNRLIQSVAPHSNLGRGKFNVIQPVFNEANLLGRVDVWLERAAEPGALLDSNTEPALPVGVANIDYDAKGQRKRIDYKNGASTFYDYDELTFRLTQLLTRRNAAAFPGDDPQPPIAGWPGRQVQNLHYTYDPAGNITHIQDNAQQTVYFRNKRVEPSNDYTYDALYRLIQATGREHLGQLASGEHRPPTAPDGFNAFHTRLDHPGNGQAMGTYTERYVYDAVGNFLQMQHRGSDPAHAGWTRAYDYLEGSLIEDGNGGALFKTSNRLTRTTLNPSGNTPQPETYLHDAHGNMVRMPHLGGGLAGPNMHWDYKDQLRQTDLGGGGTVFYVYDASGQRVRKVWEKAPGLIEERIYLSGFEIFRKHNGPIGANTATLERETLHVMDDRQHIALVETRTLDIPGNDPAPRQLIRYQFGNHLGSVSLELDDQAQIISYEEYAPYGSSTYQAVHSQTETAKRYRYTGKERDEESGFYYHVARYYAPWLGRWASTDPLGVLDGMNVYLYVHCSPIRINDPSGYAGEDFSDLQAVVDDLNKSELKVDLTDKRAHAKPSAKPMSKREAREYANKQAKNYRKTAGMNQGGTVQAGHTAAARHAAESGITKQDWDKQPMQELHSRKGKGLDVTVTDQTGQSRTTTRHRAQEGLIDDAVERSKAANGGKLTPQGQLDAAAEVKWRTENVPMDQRDVEALRKSGPALPEKGPPVDPHTGRVVSNEAKVLKSSEEVGEKVLKESSKGMKVAAKLGKAGRHLAAAIPIAGIVLGQASAAHAASQGDYMGTALDEAGFIPVAGDLLDAARGGIALGEALDEGLGISDVAAEHGERFEKAAKYVGLGEDASRIVGATGAALSSITVAPTIALKRTVVGWFQ